MTQLSTRTNDTTADVLTPRPGRAPGAAMASARAAGGRAQRWLKAAATSWFAVAIVGQFMFVAYVIGFYGRTAAAGRFESWNNVMPHGYVAGDGFGNLVVILHLAFTVVVLTGGALQLIPMVRRRWPRFHRWNGRIYLFCVVVISLGGLHIIATRGAIGRPLQTLAVGINALLILAFAWLALHHARAGRIDRHRRWALRLFLAVSGVWFFRIGLMFWIVVNQGPRWFDANTFRGPFLIFLGFAQYALPLLVLELTLRAQDHGGPRRRIAMAIALAVLTLVTAVGIIAASALLWLPRF